MPKNIFNIYSLFRKDGRTVKDNCHSFIVSVFSYFIKENLFIALIHLLSTTYI